MEKSSIIPLPLPNQILYSCGSLAFTLLERLIILQVVFYYLPPKELGLHNLVPDRTYLGIITVAGTALLLGRVLDGLADPIIAALSDNSRARIGRRKKFLLAGALPLSLCTFLVFSPPGGAEESLLNGFWLALWMCLFYISFTAYVNPYLALMSELGHTDKLRINISTFMAFFGLIGMVVIVVIFPQLIAILEAGGMETRQAYRLSVGGLTLFSMVILYLAALAFDEKKHCLPAKPSGMGTLQSLFKTFSLRPFRIFLTGELFLQFAMNTVTLGLIYYAIVVFRQEQGFLTVLGGIAIGAALLSFPLVNIVSKKFGKKKVIMGGVLILGLSTAVLYLLSFNMEGPSFYFGLAMIGLSGIPLAILTILINPTVADMARAEHARTGERREAMFFGARAIPLKATIALAGVNFTFLLSTFGKDVAEPLGVQLSILVVSVSSFLGFLAFSRYPENEVKQWLDKKEHL